MQHENTERRRGRIPLILMTVVCLLLCGALLFTIISFQNYKNQAQETISTHVKNEEELEATTIPLETFQGYAEQFGVSVEFVQQFFPDKIVYREDGTFVYSEIDPSLPKHSYNWNNLVRANGRIEYHEDGVSTAAVGIDVSKHQGEIDWKKVKADGIDYAIIRMGNRGYGTGKLVADETFAVNARGALDAGLDIGVYFFSQAINNEEALEEVEMLLDAIKEFDITYPVIFDTEASGTTSGRVDNLTKEQLTDVAVTFCDAVKDAGYKPMIYANVKWFVTKLDLARLQNYDKWIAQYFRSPFFPYKFEMWQYSSTATVDGIEGDVDLNLCFANYANGTGVTSNADDKTASQE